MKQSMATKTPLTRTVPSPFGDSFDVGMCLPPSPCILFQADGPAKPQLLRLLLPHQVYRQDLERLTGEGYTHFAVCPVDTFHWVELALGGDADRAD